MKIIAIDYGLKRTGIAETDDLQMIASPLTTVETKNIFEFLDKYLKENQVETLVIGEPLKEDGTYNELELDIVKFIDKLKKKYPALRIDREDERYSSKLAFQTLIDGGAGRKKRRNKALTDMVSAAIILQDYLKRTQ